MTDSFFSGERGWTFCSFGDFCICSSKKKEKKMSMMIGTLPNVAFLHGLAQSLSYRGFLSAMGTPLRAGTVVSALHPWNPAQCWHVGCTHWELVFRNSLEAFQSSASLDVKFLEYQAVIFLGFKEDTWLTLGLEKLFRNRSPVRWRALVCVGCRAYITRRGEKRFVCSIFSQSDPGLLCVA